MSGMGRIDFRATQAEGMGRVKERMPEVVRAFGAMFQGIMKPGALSAREKELIALGIGVAVRCEGCIWSHVEKCLKAGATPDEVMEAAGVAVMMQGGPSYTCLPTVLDALDGLGGPSAG